MNQKNTIKDKGDHLTMTVPSAHDKLLPFRHIKLDVSSMPIIENGSWQYDVRNRVKKFSSQSPTGEDLAEKIVKLIPKGKHIEHENGDIFDYRRSNLILCD